MLSRTMFGWSRLLTATVCIVALVHRMIWGMGSQTLASQNFFAYLTIQSNTAFAVLAIIAGVVALRTAEDPPWLTTARALVLSWTITAGLAFALIVWQAGVRGIPITVPWSDVVLHFVLPAWTIVAWVIGPGRRAASWRVVPFVLLYPVLWGVFTIWRGGLIGWYPYYFLDIRQVSGIFEMALTCAIALAIFATVASALVALSRLHPTAAPAVPDPVRSSASVARRGGAARPVGGTRTAQASSDAAGAK
ncbi:Pr6Pr family membrane protein [Microbacterium sp.]|uniref:Pr6Pr family membrane protein n=1 Tax=Microbacterium sp. TaxID=51671 RepID=UPI0028119EFA|nr:Pr6Pr family membrane protein [Microbacterium sp.]